MSKPVSLSFTHFGFFVADLELMKKFYTDVMGFYVTDEGVFPNGQSLVFLRRDRTAQQQVIRVDGHPGEGEGNRINQISFFVDRLEDLQAFYLKIKSACLDDIQAVTHGNAWSVYFRDPEGNRIEVYTHTPWYVSQPLREPLDLEMSAEEIHKMTEMLCRSLPGFQSRNDWLASMKQLMQMDKKP